MTRKQLIDRLARTCPGLIAEQAEVVVKTLLAQMSAQLAAGERIEIRGFGSFSVHHRPPRQGRNPRTGETVAVPARHRPHFKPGKARSVVRRLRRAATTRGLSGKPREPLDQCLTYLVNHFPYLNYPHYLARGYPIATGVIEGACRYLVKDRMELTGARWGLPGGEAVLKLRALYLNGDFDAYWEFHEQQEYQRNHAAKFSPIPPTRPQLQLIPGGKD